MLSVGDTVTICVEGNPRPKARMTRFTDRRKEQVRLYRGWAREIVLAYKEQCGPLFDAPVAVGFRYRRRLFNCDMDNLNKGVLDALTKTAFPNDTLRWIPVYDGARAERVDSDAEAGMELTIRPLEGTADERR